MTPADPASTVGHIDIWADPASGLPLMVEMFGRGSARPALESQFFQVSPWRPDLRVLTPVRASGTGFTVTSASNLAGALSNLGLVMLPGQLAGRDRLPVPAGVRGDRRLRGRAGHVRRPGGPRLGRAEPGRGRPVGRRHGAESRAARAR